MISVRIGLAISSWIVALTIVFGSGHYMYIYPRTNKYTNMYGNHHVIISQ